MPYRVSGGESHTILRRSPLTMGTATLSNWPFRSYRRNAYMQHCSFQPAGSEGRTLGMRTDCGGKSSQHVNSVSLTRITSLLVHTASHILDYRECHLRNCGPRRAMPGRSWKTLAGVQ